MGRQCQYSLVYFGGEEKQKVKNTNYNNDDGFNQIVQKQQNIRKISF